LTKSAWIEKFIWNIREKWDGIFQRCLGNGKQGGAENKTTVGLREATSLKKPTSPLENKTTVRLGEDTSIKKPTSPLSYDDNDDDLPPPPGCCSAGLTNLVSDLSHLRNDAERRDLISIGAAAGFATAFGAPVGGVLFSMEEASTFFARNLLFKTLAATATATFFLAVYRGDLSEYGIISLSSYNAVENNIFLNSAAEIPLYILTGVVGGLLGAAFNMTWERMHKKRKLFFEQEHFSPKQINIYKLSEVAYLSIFTSMVMFLSLFLPPGLVKRRSQHISWKTTFTMVILILFIVLTVLRRK